jgi:hypothetical protein
MMKVISSCLFLFFVFWVTILSASEQAPIAVSPASDVGIAKVSQLCPTFSWTAVDWATRYRVEVFKTSVGAVLNHKDMAATSYPVLLKEILGAATSWTPSTDEQLSSDDIYVWYVQAIDEFGSGVWSQGRFFQIEVALGLAPIEKALQETLEEHGVNREVISDVIANVRTTATKESGSQTNFTPIGIQGNETGSNTWYGEDAGFSLTTGLNNSFFGANAGYSNTTGNNNTFMGMGTGITNTTGYSDTFLGMNSGYFNTTGYENTFVGFRAGFNNTTGNSNTFLGVLAGDTNTTGIHNTLIGWRAGTMNSTGDYNTFIGSGAGFENTIGIKNTFLGTSAGIKNTSGNENTFLGHSAGRYNTTGSGNIFIGSQAGENNTTGYNNTFVGNSAGESNTSGRHNTFIGEGTGYSNTEGEQNTFMGPGAGYKNTTGDYNIFLGPGAGTENTSGFQNTFMGWVTGNRNSTGQYNTFIGGRAGYENTTGTSNTFIGYRAGYYNTTSSNNTFLGCRAGDNNTTGNNNVFLGYRAGSNETGSNKLYIDSSSTSDPLIYGEFDNDRVGINGWFGVGTEAPSRPMHLQTTGLNGCFLLERTDGATNYMNATAGFGNFGTVTNHPLGLTVNSLHRMVLWADNSVTLQNGASCTAGGVWTDASSRDLKENINDLSTEQALNTLAGLQPVTYNYKADHEDGHVGFIAEDVPDLVASKDRKGMSPMDVVAVLTKVLQEQQKVNEELRNKIAQLEVQLMQDK